MLRSITLFFMCVMLGQCVARAQSVSGHIEIAGHRPLPFVTVAVLQDSIFIAGGISDEAGAFSVSAHWVAGTRYMLRLSLVGYQTLEQRFTWPDTTLLAQLVMVPNQQLLGEVVVSGKKPLITRQTDRYTVNVEDSYLANGRTGLEVLQRSPGLWVSPDGTIRITGGQSVTVMINDVVQRMSPGDLDEYLRSLRSEDISKLEIIPNPPSEYEASSTGGIVHIILKKSRRNGLTGNLSGTYKQQVRDPYMALGGAVDFKSQQLYITGSYNFTNDQTTTTGWEHVRYSDQSNLNTTVERHNDVTRNQFRFGLAYDISSKHSLNIQVMGMDSRLINRFESGLDYSLLAAKVKGTANSDWRREPRQGSYTLNYGWKIDSSGSVLRVIADYTTNSKSELNEVLSVYSDTARNRHYRTLTPSTTHLTSIQADYTKALSGQQAVKAGIKHVHTARGNTVLTERYENLFWRKDIARSNDFRYAEDLLMFYGSYEKIINKTSVKAGLRGENTWAKGYFITLDQQINRNYFGWFPSLFITQNLDEKEGNSLELNYTRRVSRPGYNDLNPYRLQVNDFSIITGNPNLVPQYTHSLRAGYTYRQNYKATVYFQSTSNYIAQTASTLDSNIIEYQSKNYLNNTEYGLSLDASVNIAENWNSWNSLIIFHQSTNVDSHRFSQQSFSIQSGQTITFKKVLDIDAGATYTSAYLQANTRQAEILLVDAGLTRKLYKDHIRLHFHVNDIFNTVREKALITYNDTRIESYQKRPTRTFSLSVNYTFRSGKTFMKKTMEQSGSEEKRRLQ